MHWPVGNAEAVPGMRNMHFRTYSVMQGLPQASAAVIAQDRTGFIWIGTQDGLARFDGYEFKVYKHDRDKPHTLSDNFVRAIVADVHGGLWVGTRSGGLDHYNPRTSHFDAVAVKHEQGDASTPVEINALAMGARGRVWIVTGGGYLQWLKPGSLSTQMAAIGPQPRLRRARVMLAMPGGGVLLGSGEGLFRVDAAGRSMSGFGPSGLDVFALALGEHNEVWVGTASAGLYHLDKHGKVLQHFTHQTGQNTNSLPDNEVRALLLDKRGTLWIAGNSAGLASLDPSQACSAITRTGQATRTAWQPIACGACRKAVVACCWWGHGPTDSASTTRQPRISCRSTACPPIRERCPNRRP